MVYFNTTQHIDSFNFNKIFKLLKKEEEEEEKKNDGVQLNNGLKY